MNGPMASQERHAIQEANDMVVEYVSNIHLLLIWY